MTTENETGSDDALLQALGAEMLRLSRRRTLAYPGSVLETSAFRILWVLSETGPRTLRDLTDELQLEQSTVNRQVNAAIKHGLIERYAVEGSSSMLVRPTPEGREAYLHDGLLRAQVLREALDELGEGRPEALVADLRSFNDALDRAHTRARVAGPPTGARPEPAREGGA
jgi:DNA-binding MarR family transcriptional regulator